MKRPVFRFFYKAPVLVATLAIATVAGCQSVPYQLKVEQTPATLLYSYTIVSGMARGQFMSGTMTLPQIIQIVTADRAAIAAIQFFRDHPGSDSFRVADQKVEDFLAVLDQPASTPLRIVVAPGGQPIP